MVSKGNEKRKPNFTAVAYIMHIHFVLQSRRVAYAFTNCIISCTQSFDIIPSVDKSTQSVCKTQNLLIVNNPPMAFNM